MRPALCRQESRRDVFVRYDVFGFAEQNLGAVASALFAFCTLSFFLVHVGRVANVACMYLTSLCLENYRAFVDRTRCELRPLTLFFGYNSAGKSSLLRSLPLFMGSLRGGGAPVDMDHASMRGGGFNDILSRPPLRTSNRLGLSMEFGDTPDPTSSSLMVSWSILEAPDLRRQIIESFEAKSKTMHLRAKIDLEGNFQTGVKHDIEFNGAETRSVDLNFLGLLPNLDLDSRSTPMATAIAELTRELKGHDTSVQWLSSVRSMPPRSQPYPGVAPTVLRPDGFGTLAALAYSEALRAEVSKWFETHLKASLVVVPMADQFQVALETLSSKPVRVPITDVGEGLIQVLPVLVAAAMTRRVSRNGSRILAIEEPESHLHPRLHAALADQFCSLANLDDGPQIVLETHSENILLAIQLQIASGTLRPDRVIVYWVRNLDDGRGKINAITFDKFGRPKEGSAMPRGVFSEDLALSRKLLEIQNSAE